MIRPVLCALLAAMSLSGCYVSSATLIEPFTTHPTATQAVPKAGAPATATTRAAPTIVAQGTFEPSDHDVAGQAMVVLDGDSMYLRLQDFNTENAPDLLVVLAQDPEGHIKGGDYVELGRPKSTNGTMNYPIPVGTDLTRIHSVVIWCRALNVNFGVAPLR